MSQTEAKPPGLPAIDVVEYGGKREGARQAIDRRLFMQLVALDAPPGRTADQTARLVAELCARHGVPAVVYADTMSPRGLGLLSWSDDPSHFVRKVRPLFGEEALAQAPLRPALAMIGRTYATGHEPDLEWTLLRRPIENVTREAYPWHVWYPLRRTAAFARLDPHEQSQILREHAQIGMAYGAQELAHDVRLACYGLDAADNEFVIGLVGPELHPLSHLVQAMRKTRQTSEFIEKMGPFFVGYALHRV
jgi:Chlorite dismutase